MRGHERLVQPTKGDSHRECCGEVARKAAIYPAILVGLRYQLRGNDRFVFGISSMLPKPAYSMMVRHIIERAHDLQGLSVILKRTAGSEM